MGVALDAVDTSLIASKVDLMEQQIARYVPAFKDVFRYIGPQLSIKTKPTGSFDDRSCYVFKTGRVFSVMSGKIDTIFYAVERILTLIEAMPDASARPEVGSLREEVLRSAASMALG